MTLLCPWILRTWVFQSFPKHIALPMGWAEGEKKAEPLCSPGGEHSLRPPGSIIAVGFNQLLVHLHQWFAVVQGMPGSHSECENQNPSFRSACKICTTKLDGSYLDSRCGQVVLYQSSTPSSPPPQVPSFTSPFLCMSAQLAEREDKQSLSDTHTGPGSLADMWVVYSNLFVTEQWQFVTDQYHYGQILFI